MSDDLPNSDVGDQLHDDLFVKRLTDSDNTEFSNDLEKGASMDEVLKAAFRRVFLQPRLDANRRRNMSKLIVAPIMVVLWIAVAVAGDANPARTVNLNKPGALETLQQSNPTHYEKVRKILNGIDRKS